MNYLQKKKLAFMSIVNSVKGFIRTITGVFPLTLTNCVDEESITDYTIYGNSVQNGTPKPDSPIEVESVGEKTTNLIDWDLLLSSINDCPIKKVENGYYGTRYACQYTSSDELVKHIKSVLKPNVEYTLSRIYSGKSENANGLIVAKDSASTDIIRCRHGVGLVKITFTLTQEQIDSIDHVYVYFHNTGGTITELQLTESDAVLPYEPYGYKIPITASSNGKTVTTNIYLDEPLRKVGDYADYIDFENGKVIRNVCEEFIDTVSSKSGNTVLEYGVYLTPIKNKPLVTTSSNVQYTKGDVISNKFNRCTDYYISMSYYANSIMPYITTSGSNRIAYTFDDVNITTVEQAQEKIGDGFYAYYVLAEPTETPITLPNIPTFKGTSILTAGTTIQPSNAEVTYYSIVKE